jgi:exosortase D (VPLPA-CTERM-specific)
MTLASQTQKTNTILIGLCFLIVAAFGFGFWPEFQKMGIRWNSDDNSYCYLIAPLFLYLCWEKRKDFQFGRFTWNLWGMAPVCLSVLLMIAGELGSMETLLYIGIYGCMVGVMFILYGLRLRHLLFPLIILAFIVPLPPFVNRMLTFNLKLAASSISVMMLRLTGASVLQDGNIIDLGITQMQVVDACSGLRYFVPLILMSLLFGFFYCKRLWQKALLLIIVLPLSIVVNSFRIFATGMLHIWGYPELAENLFHDFAGLVIFLLAAAILFGVCMVLKRLGTGSKEKDKKLAVYGLRSTGSNAPDALNVPNDQNGWKKPVATTAILCLLFVGSGQALQKLPSARNLPDRTSFAAFPMTIGGWQAKRDYLSQDILDSLWSDDYVSATYFAKDNRSAIHLLIPFYEYQGTRNTAHAPQSCMLGGGWALISSQDRVLTSATGVEFPIMTTVWEKGGTRVLGSYFFFQRGRTIISPWMNKYWLMVDAFTRQRTDGALVRAEMTLAPGQSMEDAYKVLEEFVGKIYEVLPQYVPL